jgi:NAD(P)-dependent dehydrogenase (short-subunit alcohol dehydrogenase family)
VALVTGAGRGIGRATAEAFAAGGWAVVIAELRPTLGRRVERALARAGKPALFVQTDVANPRSVDRAVRMARRRFRRLDCVVNNAGVVTPGPLSRLALRDLKRMLAVNLQGPLIVSRSAIPALRRQGQGSIVNVASQLGKQGIADYVTYCATKFGVVGLSAALADELSGTGVSVWAVCPGLVDTELARRAVGVRGRERARLIRPASVARVIVALATGRRRAASGAAVDVLR